MSFYRASKPSTYYWEYLKRFGERCYRTWRAEFFISVVLAIISSILTWGDKTAWESTKVFLVATAILYGCFVVFNFLYTPYILHRERTHPIEGGNPHIEWKFGLWGGALLLTVIAGTSYGVFEAWFHKLPSITVTLESPAPPTAAQIKTPAESNTPRGGRSPKQVIPAQSSTPTAAAPAQPPQGTPSPAPATFLERIIQTDRGLTPDDRNRLSNALYEYNQFLEQGRTLGYKVNTEFGKLNQDRQSGSLAKNVDEHIKTFRDMDAPAWAYYHGLDQIQAKWKYYPDQTAYLLGDNPYNLGPGALINTVEGMAGRLTDWSKIVNRDQLLNIEAEEQTDFEQALRKYFDWLTGCQQRLEQIRQSIQPNGVVQPIPNQTPAPAPAMFT